MSQGPRRRPPACPTWVAAGLLALAVAGLVAALAWDDVTTHREAARDAARQAQRAADLGRQLRLAHDESGRLTADLAARRAENDRLQAEARSPTLAMWNACGGPCTIAPGDVRVGSVPDTFQLLLTFTADVPVR